MFVFLAALLAVPMVLTGWRAVASPAERWSGDHFGPENMPATCVNDGPIVLDGPDEQPPGAPVAGPTELIRDNVCYHQRLGLNALDSPQIDVLVLVPVQPDAERQMRIVRQSVEMWEGGIDYLAGQMGMPWLRDGVDFHITLDYVDLTGEGNGGEFTTYPVVDPEIVVVATHNNALLFGIGIDPLAQPVVEFGGPLAPANDVLRSMQEGIPCLPVENPFDVSAWEAVPGFDSHHAGRGGTYDEDCEGGTGGNVCFAINTTLDTPPELLDWNEMFDLVAHEFGHCLSLGHVGDGAEGYWGVTPTADIMAYSDDPPEGTKCVSTLDVESFAVKMSNFLDVDGDGDVDEADRLEANSPVGNDGGNAFQVQDPSDSAYASSTGLAAHCPQPDIGLVPGEKVDWTPEPVDTIDEQLRVTSPSDGATSDDGSFTVQGTVERVGDAPPPPPGSAVHLEDPAGDTVSPYSDVEVVDIETTATHLNATLRVAELWPATTGPSGGGFNFWVNGNSFDSGLEDGVATLYDSDAGEFMTPEQGTSTWDAASGTVTFSIARDYLTASENVAPYEVRVSSTTGVFGAGLYEDYVPDGRGTVTVVGPAGQAALLAPAPTLSAQTVELHHPDGNTFFTEDSSLGEDIGTAHQFHLDVARPSDIELELTWTGTVPGSDLDLATTAPGSAGGGTGLPDVILDGQAIDRESISLRNVTEGFDITVDPFLITDPLDGVTYTLTATVTELSVQEPAPDGDGDGVPDAEDTCPTEPGTLADGCPPPPAEVVKVYVDGELAGSEGVDASAGRDAFSIPVTVTVGTHELRIVWERRGKVQAVDTRSVHHPEPVGPDADGDAVGDASDNCPDRPNADQANFDGDARGDVCDPDDDNDGANDNQEAAKGTNPRDPTAYPKNATLGLTST